MSEETATVPEEDFKDCPPCEGEGYTFEDLDENKTEIEVPCETCGGDGLLTPAQYRAYKEDAKGY